MKIKFTFQIKNSNIAHMDDRTRLAKFGECFGYCEDDIEEIKIHVIETGDIVTISQPYGGYTNEDGITYGSKIRQITGIYKADNDVCGSIYTPGGAHIQAMDAMVENNYLLPKIN